MRRSIALLLAAAAGICSAQAQEFQIVKVPSVSGFPLDQLKPQTIVFNDYREAEISEGASGFIRTSPTSTGIDSTGAPLPFTA